MLSAADIACYAAKDMGRDRVHVYRDDDAELRRRHTEMQWVARIKNALAEDRFVLHQQKMCSLSRLDGTTHCAEYLVRMLDEKNNIIMPGAFIPAAERYGIMPLLDRWVVRSVIAHLADNLPENENKDSFFSSIYLAAHSVTAVFLIIFGSKLRTTRFRQNCCVLKLLKQQPSQI